jgi:hypothetical protein
MSSVTIRRDGTVSASLAALAALRVVGADGYKAERFVSSIGSAGTLDIGELLSRDETLQLLSPGRGVMAATASFPSRVDVDAMPGRIPAAGDVPVRMPRLLDFTRGEHAARRPCEAVVTVAGCGVTCDTLSRSAGRRTLPAWVMRAPHPVSALALRAAPGITGRRSHRRVCPGAVGAEGSAP